MTLKNGSFEQANFHEYVPIRLAQVPEIDVTIIAVGSPSERCGRTGFDHRGAGGGQRDLQCVGARVRHMPISPEAVLAAMKKSKA